MKKQNYFRLDISVCLFYTFISHDCMIHCVQKKRDRNIFVVSSTKLRQFWSDEIWYIVSWVHFPQNHRYVFHLTRTLSLHYMVKLEMFIADVCTTELLEKETPEFISPQLWPPNSPHLNSVDYSYSMWDYCKRRCTKYTSLICMKWNSDWEQWAKLDHIVTKATIRQWRRP